MARQTNSLYRKLPEEWVRDINKLPQRLRAHIAHLVWWDWFAHMPVHRRWTHLDKYIKTPVVDIPSTEKTIDALVLIGYSQHAAYRRVGKLKEYLTQCK